MRKAQEEGSQKERLERLLPLHLLVYARCLALSLPIQRPIRRRAADQPPHGLGLRERTWASAWSKSKNREIATSVPPRPASSLAQSSEPDNPQPPVVGRRVVSEMSIARPFTPTPAGPSTAFRTLSESGLPPSSRDSPAPEEEKETVLSNCRDGDEFPAGALPFVRAWEGPPKSPTLDPPSRAAKRKASRKASTVHSAAAEAEAAETLVRECVSERATEVGAWLEARALELLEHAEELMLGNGMMGRDLGATDIDGKRELTHGMRVTFKADRASLTLAAAPTGGERAAADRSRRLRTSAGRRRQTSTRLSVRRRSMPTTGSSSGCASRGSNGRSPSRWDRLACSTSCRGCARRRA